MASMQIPRPALILVVMTAIAGLLAMFRLGQYTQRLDSSFVPPSPTEAVTRTPTKVVLKDPPVSLFGKACGLSFLYPSSMEIKSVSTQSALLTEEGRMIQITCLKDDLSPVASPAGTLTLAGKRATYVFPQKRVTQFSLDLPRIGKVRLTVHDDLKELVTRTLSIITPTLSPITPSTKN
jgi:hypothetical protein